MEIQINTDNHIEGREELFSEVAALVEETLARFGEQVTRVEVHLTDENSAKPGEDDKRCVMEARLAGLQPLAVTSQGATLRQAIAGAAEKLRKALGRTLGRLRTH